MLHTTVYGMVPIMPGLTASRPAAFFDRDGVINLDHGYVGTLDRFELVEGAASALRACRGAGFLILVVTNQSGVARGYFDETVVEDMHRQMRSLLAAEGAVVDDIRYCPHHVDAVSAQYRRNCAWRKPAPGMILSLIEQWHIDPSRSFLVGDKPSDLEAAAAADVAGYRFMGGNLADFIRPILAAAFSSAAMAKA